MPLNEVKKLLDLYGVSDPERSQLLSLASDSNRRGWWEDYADAISEEYQAFIGLEAEAASIAQWQIALVPGLLQTEDYARRLYLAYQSIDPIAPGVVERRVKARMIRQEVLTREPPVKLSAIIDESVLLRQIGDHNLMHAQLHHLLRVADLPNVELKVLQLGKDRSLMVESFVMFSFEPVGQTGQLHDVVSTEALRTKTYVEGETDTYLHRLVFENLEKMSLSPAESSELIQRTATRVWA